MIDRIRVHRRETYHDLVARAGVVSILTNGTTASTHHDAHRLDPLPFPLLHLSTCNS